MHGLIMAEQYDKEIAEYFINNFQNLFSSDQPSISHDLDELIPAYITDEENNNLMKIPQEEEIKKTI